MNVVLARAKGGMEAHFSVQEYSINKFISYNHRISYIAGAVRHKRATHAQSLTAFRLDVERL